YITTPILMLLLEEIDRVDEIVVMMQKEVADRIMAQPGTKDYGVLTLSVQYYAEVSQVCRVSRGSFMPSPNVDSTVLHLKRRRAERFEEEKLLFSVIRAAFGQRRKTLQNALSTGLHLDKQTVTNGIMNVGLSPQVRGETLRLQDFIAISREIRRNDAKAEL
ncbi:MAG: rRNA adenine dimethyltransferase family protein, partial [Bacillota bacterium]|nr:rRNA adenine dimethyltransferase family protein [Bacillota bacterium]